MKDIIELQKIVEKDIKDLYEKLHPKSLKESVELAAAYPRYIILATYSGRADLLRELGADISKLEELINKEFEKAARLPLGL